MARTYAFAIGGAICPGAHADARCSPEASCPSDAEEKENCAHARLHQVYDPLFDLALRHPRGAVFFTVGPLLLCVAFFPLLGGEFMPQLEEGNFWIRATLPMSISLEQSSQYVGRMREILRKHPEAETVVSQLGRPDDGTDVSGFYNIEFFAPLKPFDEWPAGLTKEKLTEQLSQELGRAFPGVVFNFSQMICDNVEEAVSGVKGENSVKVVGPDLETNEELGDSVVDMLSNVRGVKDLGLFASLGQPSVTISRTARRLPATASTRATSRPSFRPRSAGRRSRRSSRARSASTSWSAGSPRTGALSRPSADHGGDA